MNLFGSKSGFNLFSLPAVCAVCFFLLPGGLGCSHPDNPGEAVNPPHAVQSTESSVLASDFSQQAKLAILVQSYDWMDVMGLIAVPWMAAVRGQIPSTCRIKAARPYWPSTGRINCICSGTTTWVPKMVDITCGPGMGAGSGASQPYRFGV